VIGASSTDVRRTESARPRGAVVTAAGPQMRAILEQLALPTFQRFARRWGYAVLAEELPTDGAGADPAVQQAKWAKLRLLREALASFPLALWPDADILVTGDDEDIASHLPPDHFQAAALEQVPLRAPGQPQHRGVAAAVVPRGVRLPGRSLSRRPHRTAGQPRISAVRWSDPGPGASPFGVRLGRLSTRAEAPGRPASDRADRCPSGRSGWGLARGQGRNWSRKARE
jgi:hypothetical protein